MVLGDARLALERELAADGPRRFDLFIVDAFTGDAIPAHLLTRECLRLYHAHLAPGGRLMLHVSNRYLDLRPLVAGLARDAGLESLVTDSRPTDPAELPATWAAIAPRGAFSAEERAMAARSRPPFAAASWSGRTSTAIWLASWTRPLIGSIRGVGLPRLPAVGTSPPQSPDRRPPCI